VSPALLEADGLCASYGSYRALFGVSLEVPEGSAVALLGSNGAGKSTFARVLTGLVPASSGSVRLDGHDVTGMPAWRIARMGVAHVPEGRGIFSSLSVEENLSLSFRRRMGRGGIGEALDKAYAGFPILAERRRQQAGTLSGGQQRMLSLAKVLAVPPRLLVADELSLGLAPVVVDAVYDGLAEIRRAGTALLVVEQHIDRALALAEHAVLLAKGEVAWQGPPSGAAEAMERILGSGRAERT
jgi:branched-chain amino acid transport system ATP-binding protein